MCYDCLGTKKKTKEVNFQCIGPLIVSKGVHVSPPFSLLVVLLNHSFILSMDLIEGFSRFWFCS